MPGVVSVLPRAKAEGPDPPRTLSLLPGSSTHPGGEASLCPPSGLLHWPTCASLSGGLFPPLDPWPKAQGPVSPRFFSNAHVGFSLGQAWDSSPASPGQACCRPARGVLEQKPWKSGHWAESGQGQGPEAEPTRSLRCLFLGKVARPGSGPWSPLEGRVQARPGPGGR